MTHATRETSVEEMTRLMREEEIGSLVVEGDASDQLTAVFEMLGGCE